MLNISLAGFLLQGFMRQGVVPLDRGVNLPIGMIESDALIAGFLPNTIGYVTANPGDLLSVVFLGDFDPTTAGSLFVITQYVKQATGAVEPVRNGCALNCGEPGSWSFAGDGALAPHQYMQKRKGYARQAIAAGAGIRVAIAKLVRLGIESRPDVCGGRISIIRVDRNGVGWEKRGECGEQEGWPQRAPATP